MLSKSLGLPQPICNSIENACFSNPPGRYCQASLSTGLKPATRFTGSTPRPAAPSSKCGRRLRHISRAPSTPSSMRPGSCRQIGGIARQHRGLDQAARTVAPGSAAQRGTRRPYFESCQETVEQEAALGFDARLRSTAGNYVLRAAIDALARKHRFAPGKLAEGTKLLSQAIAFDVANAMTLHREEANKGRGSAANNDRRSDCRLRQRHRRCAHSHHQCLDIADNDVLDHARGG